MKRKFEYKGHYSFQYVRPQRILQALQWLKANNQLYKNVFINQTWEEDCANDDIEVWNELTGNITDAENQINSDNTEENEVAGYSSSESEHENEEIVPITRDESQNFQLETCVQPADLSIDASRIMSIAPGEGKKPLSILQDANFEEFSFPTLFLIGQFGYTCARKVKLSAKKYFQKRILEKNGNFASNIEYLFVAQFVAEWKQTSASISVALRKSLSSYDGEAYNAGFFRNSDHIRPMITKDDAYRFLRTIRGSPPYWQKVMFELLAAIKQFKIFTWFLTLSAADMKWEDTLRAISR